MRNILFILLFTVPISALAQGVGAAQRGRERFR